MAYRIVVVDHVSITRITLREVKVERSSTSGFRTEKVWIREHSCQMEKFVLASGFFFVTLPPKKENRSPWRVIFMAVNGQLVVDKCILCVYLCDL